MTKNETLNTIKSLRSTHWAFNDQPVSKEDVETIVRHSMRAANSDNLTDYSIVVIDDPEVINLITDGESEGKPCTLKHSCGVSFRILPSSALIRGTL